MLDTQCPMHRAVPWGGALVAAAVLVLPQVLAEPAMAATSMNTCPLPAVHATETVSAAG